MQVIVTLAGQGLRFKNKNYSQPKPIVPVMGLPAISYLIASFSSKWKLFFVIGDHFKETAIESEIKKLCPDADITYVPYSERGPIDPVLAVLKKLDPEDSVAVSYCDYAMIWNAENFEKFVVNSKCNISIVSYRGFHPTYLGPNTYAHLKVDEETKAVDQIQEKKLFGTDLEDEWTSTGFYYFRTLDLLKQGLQLQIDKDLKSGNEFYTSLAIQALMTEKKINVLNYPISHFMQMGTPEDIELIEKWHQFIVVENKKNKFESGSLESKLYNYWKYVFRKLPFRER
ncbi:MAG: NTP transferase domain-containing protein [Pseudobdellovibrio sp.]